jgi:hypothetical protein
VTQSASVGKYKPTRFTLMRGYLLVERGYQQMVIPYSHLLPLIRWVWPKVRTSRSSFDPEVAMHRYLTQEEETTRALKAQKREVKELRRRADVATRRVRRKRG